MMRRSTPLIVGVSDVVGGYGSPQIPALMDSLAEHFGARQLLIEPGDPARCRSAEAEGGAEVQVVALPESPYETLGRTIYVHDAARRVGHAAPDVLVIFSAYALPVLARLRRRPRLVIYMALESVAAYGEADLSLHRLLADRVDLVLFPEENRARLDVERCGLRDASLAVLYNAARKKVDEPLTPIRRNGRLLYSGTIDRRQTFAEWFLEPGVVDHGIDLYGAISGEGADTLRRAFEGLGSTALRYHGLIEASTLRRLRPAYDYALVLWSPELEHQRYAAPNKFFEAIADGVPPIVTPHPQCQMLVRRYGCGIVLEDFSLDAFRCALERARALAGSEAYGRLVAGCRRAHLEELNWEAQFEKCRRLLPEAL